MPAAHAQSGKEAEKGERKKGWVVQCTSESRDAKPVCTVRQQLYLRKTRQKLLSVAVRTSEKTRNTPMMVIQAPLGLHLPAGIKVEIDGKDRGTLPLQTCNNNGCFAVKEMDRSLLNSFRRGKKMVVTFQNTAKRNIGVPVDLGGFTAAYEKVK